LSPCLTRHSVWNYTFVFNRQSSLPRFHDTLFVPERTHRGSDSRFLPRLKRRCLVRSRGSPPVSHMSGSYTSTFLERCDSKQETFIFIFAPRSACQNPILRFFFKFFKGVLETVVHQAMTYPRRIPSPAALPLRPYALLLICAATPNILDVLLPLFPEFSLRNEGSLRSWTFPCVTSLSRISSSFSFPFVFPAGVYFQPRNRGSER